MPLPPTMNTVPVHISIMDGDGNPATGFVSFQIPIPRRDTTSNVIVGPSSIIATLAAGQATVNLPATDDPDVTPIGWTYSVTVSTNAWNDSFQIQIPIATVGTLEFADIAPASAASSGTSFLQVGQNLADLPNKATARTNLGVPATTFLNVKDFGALGDGVTDDSAAITAAIAAAKDRGIGTRAGDPDPYTAHDHRGVAVYLPAGSYLINSPLVLPRSGVYRAHTVGFIGENQDSTIITAGSSFPSSRALIEWETAASVSRNDVRDQVIKNLTLVPKVEAGAKAIHFKLFQAHNLYTQVNDIDTMYRCTFENLIINGYNSVHTSLIRLEGRIDYCDFTNITGDTSQAPSGTPPLIATKLLHFDDLSHEWATVAPILSPTAADSRIYDVPGANWCHARGLWCGHRGGWLQLIFGRVSYSIVENLFAQGSLDANPSIHILDGGGITGRSWFSEGWAENGIFTFENCSHVHLTNIGLAVTDTATAPAPGTGLRLINTNSSVFSGRRISATSPAFSEANSKLVRIDADCHDLDFREWHGNETLANEFAVDPAAYNIKIDYTNITDADGAGTREQWTDQVMVGAHLMAPGHYMVSEGSRNTTTLVANQEVAVPIHIGREGSIDRIGIEVTTAGGAGSLVRLGVRDQTQFGLPGALLLDAGTVAGDVVATVEKTISLRLRKPGTYWLTATAQNGTPTVRSVIGNIGPCGAPNLANALSATSTSGYFQNSVSGALPATFTIGSRIGTAVLIAIRAV